MSLSHDHPAQFAERADHLPASDHTVTTTIPVGAEPTGVAVNQATDVIYAANTADNTVSVISGQTNAVVATIPVGLRPGGVAVNWKIDRAYVANAGGTVSVLAGC